MSGDRGRFIQFFGMAIVRRCYSLGSPSSRRRGCPLWRSFPRALQRPLMLTRSPRTGAPCRSVAAPLADRQAGMRADAACKGEGRLLLGGRWRWQGQCCTPLLAPQLVGRSVGRLQSAKGRARERQRCLIPSLPVAVLPSVLRSLPPPTAATVLSSKWRSRETETELDGPSRKVRGVISGLRDE